MADPDFLNMSDEDFLAQSPASGESPVEAQAEVQETNTSTTVEEVGAEHQAEEPVVEQTQAEKPVAEKPKKAPKAAVSETKVKPDVTDTQNTSAEATSEDEHSDDDGAEESETEGVGTDYEAFYSKVMAPFKANGRTIELKTPEEAIQLMQMGANYTKKMQELVPQRKLMTMLQQNGLMDEGKISYLIDLDKKNPEAIKKLIKDAGIDPMEIDTSVDHAYREGNHRVSDEAVAFDTALEDMKSDPEQLKTLQIINGDWDQASKEALWKNPEIMGTIHQQRANGIYDRIATELDRRRTLGQIPANIPFLQAYKVIGDQMTQANAFADLNLSVASSKSAQPTVVETRVAAPKAAVKNNARAAAASSNRSTPAKGGKETSVNHLAMSDEDFLKLDQFNGRV